MKKRILSMVLLMVVSFMVFNINVYADATMVIGCDIKNLPSDKDKSWIENITDLILLRDYTGQKVFLRLTDNKGEVFMAPADDSRLINTIPNITWDGKSEIINSNFDKQQCPVSIAHYSTLIGDVEYYHMFGSQGNIGIATLDKPRYVIYEMYSEKKENECNALKNNGDNEVIDKICKRLIIAEGYNSKGAFAFIGPDLKETGIDEVVSHQIKLINTKNISVKYFMIDEIPETLIGNNYSVDDLYNDWYELSIDIPGDLEDFIDKIGNYDDYQIKIIAASRGEGKTALDKVVSKWLENNDGDLAGYNHISNIIEDSDFVDECTSITESLKEGNDYSISKDEVSALIPKLEEAQNALDEAYNVKYIDCGTGDKTSVTSSITSCLVYSDMLGINEIVDLAYKKNDEHMINKGFIIDALYKDVSDSLKNALNISNKKINIIDVSSDLDIYTEKFYTVIAYLRSKAGETGSGLGEFEKKLNEVYDKYKEMVERHKLNIYPVVDCETLLGEDLINKINSYLNIFKIAVPILLIGLGIVDFTKAVFAGEEEMKKAQKAFIKRLFIALLIFLIPTVINFILYLANKVWPIISTDSCGLY